MKNLQVASLVILLLAAILYVAPSDKQSKKTQFIKFKILHNKVYASEYEEAYRFNVFLESLKIVEEHNANLSKTYKMGINQFSDLVDEEFINQILMKNLPPISQVETIKTEDIHTDKNVPDSIDWRAQGGVSDVKNQGACGSCWAFSTTGVLESTIKVQKGGDMMNLSEQQMVSCCGKKGYECQGCSGAWPEWAANYIQKEGLSFQNDYPYTAKNDQCRDANETSKFFLNQQKAWTLLDVQAQCTQLKEAVSQGPVSVCLDASNWGRYSSGVFENCGTTNLNHAVLAVGYDNSGNWIVKNSWGKTWGEQGFIRLKNGGTCGINKHAMVLHLI